jgi:hypothetical protein
MAKKMNVPGLAVSLVLVCGFAQAARQVKVKDLPKGFALENSKLAVAVEKGAWGPVVTTKAEGAPARIGLVLHGAGGASKVDKVEKGEAEGGGGAVRFTSGAAEAEIVLGVGRVHVEVRPGKGASFLEVRTPTCYAVLPDFFADDVIYDPAKFESDALAVPAENFLLQMVEGGSAVVMGVWQGSLKPGEKDGGRDPRVDLALEGEGDARRITSGRIEFLSKPVYVGVLAGRGIWHNQAVDSMSACTMQKIDWKRPFDAKWRTDFVVADGKRTNDWKTRIQSFQIKGPPKPRQRGWDKAGRTAMHQEQLGKFFYPCVFKGDETYVCLYADRGERKKADGINRKERRKERDAKKKGEEYTPKLVNPPNIYEKTLIYPLDRVEATPVSAYTVVDVMRATLGQGPCEYILDLEGVKPRPRGGDRELLEVAICPLYDRRIYPLLKKAGKKKLTEKDRELVVQVCEDIQSFIHAVYDRLREYEKFGRELIAFCEKAGAQSEDVKVLAGRVSVLAQDLTKDVGALDNKNFFRLGPQQYTKGMPAVIAHWDKLLPDIATSVKANEYDVNLLRKIGGSKPIGDYQDQMVARSRRRVKAIRQEAALADGSTPEVASFAAKVRDMCQKIMRNKHPKEGL